jgi:predicted AAA+ superfamily ATPase
VGYTPNEYVALYAPYSDKFYRQFKTKSVSLQLKYNSNVLCLGVIHLEKLSVWAKRENHKPLILRGSRQVGKTTIVNMFSQEFVLRSCQ